jgi:hypothetical protein
MSASGVGPRTLKNPAATNESTDVWYPLPKRKGDLSPRRMCIACRPTIAASESTALALMSAGRRNTQENARRSARGSTERESNVRHAGRKLLSFTTDPAGPIESRARRPGSRAWSSRSRTVDGGIPVRDAGRGQDPRSTGHACRSDGSMEGRQGGRNTANLASDGANLPSDTADFRSGAAKGQGCAVKHRRSAARGGKAAPSGEAWPPSGRSRVRGGRRRLQSRPRRPPFAWRFGEARTRRWVGGGRAFPRTGPTPRRPCRV